MCFSTDFDGQNENAPRKNYGITCMHRSCSRSCGDL